MEDKEEIILSRLEDLAAKSDKAGVYTFSDFLAPEQVQAALNIQAIRRAPHMLWGGAHCCERKLFCFGSVEDMGYEPEFPIAVVRLRPAQEKFAQQLGHRDFMGAVMNLGVKRQVVGDIFIKDNTAYMFLKEQIAPFVMDNLNKVKNTQIRCGLLEKNAAELEELRPRTERIVCTAPSERLDAVIAAVYKLSRGNSAELIRSGLVQVNHRLSGDAAALLSEGDLVSVRGKGRFLYSGSLGQSKKGRLRIAAEIYVT